MAPMSDSDRIMLSAMYELNRGKTQEEAASHLQHRFGFLTPEQANTAVIAAGRAITMGEMLQFADPSATVADMMGTDNPDRDSITVDVTVAIGDDEATRTYRTLRLSVDPSSAMEDIIGMIEDTIEDWDNSYGEGNQSAGFTISSAW